MVSRGDADEGVVVEAPLSKLEKWRRLEDAYADQERGKAAERRTELLRRFPHPLALARHFEPATVIVPSVELLSRTWVDVLNTPDGRAVISQPAQTGKTVTARWSLFWALLQDPSRRIMYGSYSLGLARDTGHEVRRLVETYGEEFGLRLDRSRYDAGDWSLERVDGKPHAGRFVCISPDSKATGIPCDLAALDDVYSGEAEANSPAVTRHVEQWWESTVRLRLRPKAPVVAIGTRFAVVDLLSRFIDEGWRRINIPALAGGKAVDSLEGVKGARTDDGWLITTRGTTPEDWVLLRAAVAERVWTSTAQGDPVVPEGNLFKAKHWNRVRPEDVPPLVTRVIACDPAETGLGDEAGILVGGRARDGQMYLLADLSGQLTQGQWARRLCVGTVRWDTDHVLQERTLGTASSLRDAWAIVTRQATALRAADGDVARAQAALAQAGDRQASDSKELAELADVVDKVLSLPSTGPRVQSVTPRQNKRVRAEAVTGLWEVGRAHIVGRLPLLEFEAQSWNPDAHGKGGGKSPNRVDVMAHLLTHLDQGVATAQVSSPAGAPRVPSRSGARPSGQVGSAASPAGHLRAIDGGVPARPGAEPRRGGRRVGA